MTSLLSLPSVMPSSLKLCMCMNLRIPRTRLRLGIIRRTLRDRFTQERKKGPCRRGPQDMLFRIFPTARFLDSSYTLLLRRTNARPTFIYADVFLTPANTEARERAPSQTPPKGFKWRPSWQAGRRETVSIKTDVVAPNGDCKPSSHDERFHTCRRRRWNNGEHDYGGGAGPTYRYIPRQKKDVTGNPAPR